MAPNDTLAGGDPASYQEAEATEGTHAHRLNSLRAAVLGANDGIVSTAGIVIGVAGATSDPFVILAAGVAASPPARCRWLWANTCRSAPSATPRWRCWTRSAASWKRCQKRSWPSWPGCTKPRASPPNWRWKWLCSCTSTTPWPRTRETELGIDPEALTNPWIAAISSAVAFTVGSILPLVAIEFAPADVKIPVTVIGGVGGAGVDRLPERPSRRHADEAASDRSQRPGWLPGHGHHLLDRTFRRSQPRLRSVGLGFDTRLRRCSTNFMTGAG